VTEPREDEAESGSVEAAPEPARGDRSPLDPAAMLRVVTELCAVLRRRGLPIAPPELMDAARALAVVGLDRRDEVREALATTLVKRRTDRALFDEAFERFFDPSDRGPRDLFASLAAQGFTEAELATLSELLAAAPSTSTLAALLGAGGGAELTRLLQRPDVARMLDGLGNPLQAGFFAQRVLDGIGMSGAKRDLGLLAMALRGALGDRGELLAQALGRALDASREEVRAHVREELDRRLRRRAESADRAENKPFTALSDVEMLEVRRAVRRLVEKLRGRARVRMKHARHGPIDVRRTMRASWKTLAVPIAPKRRVRRRDRPKLVVVCDVSDSVRLAARFMLELVYALAELFADTRSFVFVRQLAEVTELFAREPVGTALAEVFAGRAVSLADNSHYGAVLAELGLRHGRAIDRRTTLVIIGDGRNNYQADEAWALSDLRRRARAVLWLNPERRSTWSIGDSAMARYAPLCDRVLEVSCAAELEEAARLLVTL
jgi:uncharacterized protein with von Willebrand factor type A (vWA) domain